MRLTGLSARLCAIAAMAAALLAPSTVTAGTWTRVEAEHFVVYGESGEKSVQTFARNLAALGSYCACGPRWKYLKKALSGESTKVVSP